MNDISHMAGVSVATALQIINGMLNVSELARVCDLSRTTVYKYLSLLEG